MRRAVGNRIALAGLHRQAQTKLRRQHLTKPMTLALCVAPQRQLSRSAQLAIQALAAKIDAMAVPAVG